MLSDTLRLNFCYLTIIHILHQRDHPKIIRYVLKNKQKNKCVCIHEVIRLIIMKIKMKMKNRSHRRDINRPRSRHGQKYSKSKKCLIMTMLTFVKQHLSNFEARFMKKLSNSEAKLKKRIALYKKLVIKSGLTSPEIRMR